LREPESQMGKWSYRYPLITNILIEQLIGTLIRIKKIASYQITVFVKLKKWLYIPILLNHIVNCVPLLLLISKKPSICSTRMFTSWNPREFELLVYISSEIPFPLSSCHMVCRSCRI